MERGYDCKTRNPKRPPWVISSQGSRHKARYKSTCEDWSLQVNLAGIPHRDKRPVSAWEDLIARPLRALHLGSIRNRILLLAVLATLVPALATTCVSYGRDRKSTRLNSSH